MAYDANGMLELNTTCYYCKNTRHMKDNSIWLNNEIAHKPQAQEQATTSKASSKKGTGTHVPKK